MSVLTTLPTCLRCASTLLSGQQLILLRSSCFYASGLKPTLNNANPNVKWSTFHSSTRTHRTLTSSRNLYSLDRDSNSNLLLRAKTIGSNPNFGSKMDYLKSSYRWFSDVTTPKDEPPPGLVAKFKWYWKNYWYVLVPVHILTSSIWFGSFYYLAYSGYDVVTLFQSFHLPESAISAIQKIPPAAGHAATAYVLYKIVSPARYTITIGGTVFTIRTLRRWGVLPTAQEARDNARAKMQDSREDMRDFVKDKREDISETRAKMRKALKDRRGSMREMLDDKRENMREIMQKAKDRSKSK